MEKPSDILIALISILSHCLWGRWEFPQYRWVRWVPLMRLYTRGIARMMVFPGKKKKKRESYLIFTAEGRGLTKGHQYQNNEIWELPKLPYIPNWRQLEVATGDGQRGNTVWLLHAHRSASGRGSVTTEGPRPAHHRLSLSQLPGSRRQWHSKGQCTGGNTNAMWNLPQTAGCEGGGEWGHGWKRERNHSVSLSPFNRHLLHNVHVSATSYSIR